MRKYYHNTKTAIQLTRKISCLILCFIFTACPSLAQDTKNSKLDDTAFWKSKDYSEIEYYLKNGYRACVITNHSYLLCQGASNYIKSKSESDFFDIVVSQKISKEYGNFEGHSPHLSAIAYLAKNGNLERQLWDSDGYYNSGSILNLWANSWAFYQLVRPGIAEVWPVYSLFNLLTGDLIQKYTSNLLSISIPNTKMIRLVGYQGYPEHGSGELYYCSADSIIHSLKIDHIDNTSNQGFDSRLGLGYASISFTDFDTGQNRLLTENELVLWKANMSMDPSKFSNFSIRVEFHQDTLVIPVEKGDFKIDNLEKSGFKVERIIK